MPLSLACIVRLVESGRAPEHADQGLQSVSKPFVPKHYSPGFPGVELMTSSTLWSFISTPQTYHRVHAQASRSAKHSERVSPALQRRCTARVDVQEP